MRVNENIYKLKRIEMRLAILMLQNSIKTQYALYQKM